MEQIFAILGMVNVEKRIEFSLMQYPGGAKIIAHIKYAGNVSMVYKNSQVISVQVHAKKSS